MTWEAVRTRCREALFAVRGRFPMKTVRRLLVGTAALGLLAIAGEAAVRARLEPALARIPTAIYTRPVPWGSRQDRRSPVPIGAVQEQLAEERIPVELGEVPNHLLQAVLAVEDQRFYQHHGLDVRRIGGALLANLRARRVTQGGSTITQQLAKNLFLSAERTPLRKLREAALASSLELRYDKATILTAYLNEIYFGQDGALALRGVGAAARYYFGKDVRKISLAESALLAGMIRAPNRLTPIRNERRARLRRNLVLSLMAKQGRISQRVAEQAERTRVGTRAHPGSALDARFFRDVVRAELADHLPDRGAAVYTTLDPGLQRAAERAIGEGLAHLGASDVQAALVAIDPRNGDILAMVGGRDYGASQFNRATRAHRQPGSAFKPVVALAALHKDRDHAPAFTLASRVEDAPLSIRTGSGQWEPSNYDRTFRGEVTVREAIEQSLNVPFARIGLAVGPERIVATARRLGFTSPLQPVPSLALGSSEVTLLELVRAYGVFAAAGRLATTRTLLGRTAPAEAPITGTAPEITAVVDPAEAYLVTSALEGVITRGTGRALDVSSRFGPLAGKTGTSNDERDAWFLAYSPTLVVGVWVGFDDGRSVGLTGAGAALPIVARFLDQAAPDDEGSTFPVPDGIEVSWVSGGGSGWVGDCDSREVFLTGTAPESACHANEFPDWERPPNLERPPEWQPPRVDRWEGKLRANAGRIAARLFRRLLTRAEDLTRSEDHRR